MTIVWFTQIQCASFNEETLLIEQSVCVYIFLSKDVFDCLLLKQQPNTWHLYGNQPLLFAT